MAGQASSVGSRVGLDAISGRAPQTARTTYLALLTAAPTDATTMATMAEVTTPGSSGYTRQPATLAVSTHGSSLAASAAALALLAVVAASGSATTSGQAAATIPGTVITRPDTGTVIRPDTGVIVRP